MLALGPSVSRIWVSDGIGRRLLFSTVIDSVFGLEPSMSASVLDMIAMRVKRKVASFGLAHKSAASSAYSSRMTLPHGAAWLAGRALAALLAACLRSVGRLMPCAMLPCAARRCGAGKSGLPTEDLLSLDVTGLQQ